MKIQDTGCPGESNARLSAPPNPPQKAVSRTNTRLACAAAIGPLSQSNLGLGRHHRLPLTALILGVSIVTLAGLTISPLVPKEPLFVQLGEVPASLLTSTLFLTFLLPLLNHNYQIPTLLTLIQLFTSKLDLTTLS
jgi:hypothetical protein